MPKPGFKPIKQVHIFTKWRKFIPHHYKDITCPLPPNSIVSKVQKPKQKKKGDDDDSDIEVMFQRHTVNDKDAIEDNNSSKKDISVADIVDTKQLQKNNKRRAPKRKKAKLVVQTAVINGVERLTEDIPSDASQ